MPHLPNESTFYRSFSSVEKELGNLFSPANKTLRVGVEGDFIAIIDIASSLKMEHTSTDGRRGASTDVISTSVRSGVISTEIIPIHHIFVGDGNDADIGKDNNAENYIFSSSSLSYWLSTTKRTKEKILQQRVVCVKNKCGPKDSWECNIHHSKSTKALSQTFGSVKHFVPKNSEGSQIQISILT